MLDLMRFTKKNNLSHHLLVATPMVRDSAFSGGVVYVCLHDHNGAVGLLLNQPIQHSSFHDILTHMNIQYDALKVPDATLLAGGPVRPGNGFVIHYPIGRWQSSVVVNQEVGVTVSRDILEAIASGYQPFEQSVVALGHSNWKPGQLEAEIMSDSWLIIPATKDIIFDAPRDQLWQKALLLAGVDNIAQFTGYSGRA